MNIAIHARNDTKWQKQVGPLFKQGLQRYGINATITQATERVSDIAIILGPNFWKHIEQDGLPYIMGNRKFIGFGEHVHSTLAISWDGFNGLGTFCVDEIDKARLSSYINVDDIRPQQNGKYSLLCEQTDIGKCVKYKSITQWYDYVKSSTNNLKIRKKSNPEYSNFNSWEQGFLSDIQNVKEAHVLNSTVSTELLYYGVDVISHDISNPCFAGNIDTRIELFHYLSHCQWTFSEIRNGDWWEKMKEKSGPRLCDITL